MQCAIFRLGRFYFLFFPPPPPPSVRRCVSMETMARGSDGPGGFTSAGSDDVKADGCKSYGGEGWKIKRGGRTSGQSGTVVIQRGAARAGWERKRDGWREKGQGQGIRGGHAHVWEERVETGRESVRGIDNSSIYLLTSYTFGCQTFVMKRMLGGLYG